MSTTIGYLISRYPSISHTFILREVRELRRLGLGLHVASINDPDRERAGLTAVERGEADETFYVKAQGVPGAIRAHSSLLWQHPARYCRGFWFAVRLGGLDLRKTIMSLLYFVEAVIVGEWMRARNLTHLHAHFGTQVATVGMIVSHTTGCGFSITIHGPDEFYDAEGCLLQRKFAGADFLCVIGSFARSQVMKLCDPSMWGKIHVTPLGIDSRIFRPCAKGFRAKPFELICVGRLVPAKGQHVLIEAVSQLLSEGREVKLRLVGDGPDRPSLEASVARLGIAKSVFFEGAVNQDRIQDLYADADAFALASFAEGIPVVLMEAMAMELPCIATWINGIPELIRDGVDGILVPPADAAALVSAIARLMDDADLRCRLGIAGRRRVMEKYELGRNIARLAQVFAAHVGEEVQQTPSSAQELVGAI